MALVKTAVVVGDGRFAAECARIIAEHEAISVGAVIHHDARESGWTSDVVKFATRTGVRHVSVGNINDENGIAALQDVRPDIIFSANNWDVIHADILALPADGVINFHNGPLPRYRGVNAPSWAIRNREARHGVTWHYATGQVDAGDIVAESEFQLSGNETAIEVVFRCMNEGLSLLPPLLDRYVQGKLAPVPQSGETRYYPAAVDPKLGYLDFATGFEDLSALVRSLTFHPFENPIAVPRIRVGEREFPVAEVRRIRPRAGEESWNCGMIREIDDQGLVVCSADSLVHVRILSDVETEVPVDGRNAKEYGLAAGMVLLPP